jgi:hypothetical protein
LGEKLFGGSEIGGVIARVVASEDGEKESGILDCPGERADLIEGGSEGDEAVAGDAAVGGFESDTTAEGGGLADRATCIGTEGSEGDATGDGGGRTSRGATWDACGIPGIAGQAEGRVFGRGAHGEFVHIGATEENGPRLAEERDGGGIVGGFVSLENLGSAGAGIAEGIEIIFEGDGDAAQGKREIGFFGGDEGALVMEIGVGVESFFAGIDLGEEIFENITRMNLLGEEATPERSDGFVG